MFKSSMSKAFFVGALLIVLIVGAYYLFLQLTKLPVVAAAPTFTLENLEGKEVQLSDYDGKVRVVEFFFSSCPDICPMTTSKLVTVQNELKQKQQLGKDVVFIAITFDPNHDTPEVLKAYIEKHGMDTSGWVVLRGSEEATKQVAKEFGVGVQKISEGNFMHTWREAVFLVDKSGDIRKQYDMGQNLPAEEVNKDISKLVRE